jgi:hypothetical protein
MLDVLESGSVAAALKLRQGQQKAKATGVDPYRNDPVGFVTTRLGELLWSKQKEICKAVVDYPRVVVPSAFNVGKSRVASRIVSWWLDTRPFGEAFVVTTAPTASQVRAILWREIGRAYWSGKLAGRLNQTEWWMAPDGARYMAPVPGEELVAVGRKSSDYDEHSFQGLHQRFMLVIIDEGAGVSPAIYDAAESLASNDDARILVIGNPTDPQSKMAEITTRPGSRWHVVTIDAYDSPNWTGERIGDDPEVSERLRSTLLGKSYAQNLAEETLMVQPGEPVIVAVPEARAAAESMGLVPEDEQPNNPRQFGFDPRSGDVVPATEESPSYKARVRGVFSADDPSSIVPLSAVRKCQIERDPPWTPAQLLPVELGCDVGAGGDEFVVRERRGPKVGRKWGIVTADWREAVELALEAIRETGATCIKVDVIGIGWGVAGRLEELHMEGKHTARVVRVNVGAASTDPMRWPKLRDQIWFQIGRELSVGGAWDLSGLDEGTVLQLCAPRRVPDSAGRSKVEPKEETRERLHRSPDDADSLLLAYYVDPGRPFNAIVSGERPPVVAGAPGPIPGAGPPVVNGEMAKWLGAPIEGSRRARRHQNGNGSH